MENEQASQHFRNWLQQHPNEAADAHAGLAQLLSEAAAVEELAAPQAAALKALLNVLSVALS